MVKVFPFRTWIPPRRSVPSRFLSSKGLTGLAPDLENASQGGPESDERDRKIADAVAEFIDALGEGHSPDPKSLLEAHPDLAPDLENALLTLKEVGTATKADPVAALGRTLGGFRILRELGRGGMGIVYEAWESALDRRVALKLLPAGLIADPTAVERFQREARVAARLHHRNIVPVHGTGIEGGTPYFTMEFVEGETLDALLSRWRSGGVPPTEDDCRRLAEMFASVADGLHHAHQLGIVHRDVKPQNLILEKGRELRILDFGLARLDGQESLTLSGEILGTPLYMSPEQAKPGSAVDHRTDIYSLGATLYEVLAWCPPLRGRDHRETVHLILTRDPKPLRWIRRSIPKDLETIVSKCLQKSPRDRYNSAEALGQDLRRFARGEPVEARSQPALEVLLRRSWRARWRISAAATVLLLLLTATALVVDSVRDSRRAKNERYVEAVTAAVLRMQLARPEEESHAESETSDPASEALLQLLEAAKIAPERPEAYYHLARCHQLLGEVEKALEAVERAIERDATFIPAVVLRTALLERKGIAPPDTLDAPAGIRSVPWAEPWLAAHRATLKGDWKEAEAAYASLIRIERAGAEAYLGASAEIYLGRGNARARIGNLIGAQEDFVTARARWREAIEPMLLLGETYQRLGHPNLAEETFRSLHEGTPFKDSTAARIGYVYHNLGKFQKALEWTGRIQEEARREHHRADYLSHLDLTDDAMNAAQRALELDAGNVEARSTLGFLLSKLGRSEEAKSAFLEILRARPNHASAHRGLGCVLKDQGDLQGAEEAFRRVLQLKPDGADGHSRLASVLKEAGKLDAAIQEFQEAVKLDPEDWVTQYNLARSLELAGRHEESVAGHRSAKKLVPGDVRPRLNLSAVLARLGRLEDAVREASALLDLDPRLPGAQDHLKAHLAALMAVTGDGALSAEARGAIEEAARAIEVANHRDPELFAALAKIRTREKDSLGAVLALEEAARLPGGEAVAHDLESARKECLPDLVSYASIDSMIPVAMTPAMPDAAAIRERLAPCRAAFQGVEARGRLLYLDARVLELDGKPREAVAKLDELLSLPRVRNDLPEPLFRLANCLRLLGESRRAVERIAEGLSRGVRGERDLVELWFRVSTVDLKRSLPEVLASLPKLPESRRSFVDDLRWALEETERGESLRINCGGGSYRRPDGALFSEDRFFTGGKPMGQRSWDQVLPSPLVIQGSPDAFLYQTQRRSSAGSGSPVGYRIPLPPGQYRLRLHFAELTEKAAGRRRFGVRIEGEEKFSGFEPLSSGFATAVEKECDVEVNDGSLEIEFLPGQGQPSIAAIEVERRREK